MLEALARSALLRVAVGVLGALLFVGGGAAVLSGAHVLGATGVALGSFLTVCFGLAERRVDRAGNSDEYSTSAFQELIAVFDPRERTGPLGYARGVRVVAFVLLFGAVLALLYVIGASFLLGVVHGATGTVAPVWVYILLMIALPFIASVIIGCAFVLFHRRAFLWLEFRRMVTASTLIAAGNHVVRFLLPTSEGADAAARGIGLTVSALMVIPIALVVCGAGYLLVNAVARKAFAERPVADPEDDTWSYP